MVNPIEPTAPLSVTLEAQQWNTVLALLAEAPYRVVAPVIQSIGEQVQAAAGQAPQPLTNGAAAHVPDR